MTHRTIAQKADTLATFRFASVFLMETLARWTPLTPELEVKILFGRHLWEFAQHADALGHRTSELRASLHYTRPPLPAYREVLDECAGFESASDRVTGVYEALVPDLARRYAAFLQETDALLDQPTIRIMDRIVRDLERVQEERHEMLAGVALAPGGPGTVDRLRHRLAATGEFVDYRPVKEVRA